MVSKVEKRRKEQQARYAAAKAEKYVLQIFID